MGLKQQTNQNSRQKQRQSLVQQLTNFTMRIVWTWTRFCLLTLRQTTQSSTFRPLPETPLWSHLRCHRQTTRRSKSRPTKLRTRSAPKSRRVSSRTWPIAIRLRCTAFVESAMRASIRTWRKRKQPPSRLSPSRRNKRARRRACVHTSAPKQCLRHRVNCNVCAHNGCHATQAPTEQVLWNLLVSIRSKTCCKSTQVHRQSAKKRDAAKAALNVKNRRETRPRRMTMTITTTKWVALIMSETIQRWTNLKLQNNLKRQNNIIENAREARRFFCSQSITSNSIMKWF